MNYAIRQANSATYAQCDGGEKAHLQSIMGACGGCLSGNCPESCCVEKPSNNQYVICQVPGEGGAAGCCIRAMGDGLVEVAASEVVTAKGKDGSDACMPSDAGAASQCPKKTCAVAGTKDKQELDCPGGVVVATPTETYSSPAKCAGGGGGDGGGGGGSAAAAGANAPAASAPSTQAATGANDSQPASSAAADSPGEGSAQAQTGAEAAVGGVPPGCTKTLPGSRCMGEPGQAEVEWKGGW